MASVDKCLRLILSAQRRPLRATPQNNKTKMVINNHHHKQSKTTTRTTGALLNLLKKKYPQWKILRLFAHTVMFLGKIFCWGPD